MGCLGEGLVAKGLQYYEMSTILAYMCMEYVCVCVWGGCPCVLWDGQEVGGCLGDTRALEGGVAKGCLSDEGAGVARET